LVLGHQMCGAEAFQQVQRMGSACFGPAVGSPSLTGDNDIH
jgi:hypothetical protein